MFLPSNLTGSDSGDGVIITCTYAILLLYTLFGSLQIVDYARRNSGVVQITRPSLALIVGLVPNFVFNLISGALTTIPTTNEVDASRVAVGGYITHALGTCTFLIYLCNMLISWGGKILKQQTAQMGRDVVKQRIQYLSVLRWCVISFVIVILCVSLGLFVREWVIAVHRDAETPTTPSLPATSTNENRNRPRYFVHATVFMPYILFALTFGVIGVKFAFFSNNEQDGSTTPKQVFRAQRIANRAQNVLAVVSMLCFLTRGVISLVIVVADSNDVLTTLEGSLLTNILLNAVPAVCILVTVHFDAILRVQMQVHTPKGAASARRRFLNPSLSPSPLPSPGQIAGRGAGIGGGGGADDESGYNSSSSGHDGVELLSGGGGGGVGGVGGVYGSMGASRSLSRQFATYSSASATNAATSHSSSGGYVSSEEEEKEESKTSSGSGL